MRKSYLLFFLLISSFWNLTSLERSEIVKALTVDEGLAQNTIIVIEEDSFGFLWMGTQAGFSRWNGKDVINYPRMDIDPFPPGYGSLIKKDSEGRLWFVPSDGRLYLRYEFTDRFIDSGLDTEALGSPISNIFNNEKNDTLLLCTKEGSLYSWKYGDSIVHWVFSSYKGNVNCGVWYNNDLFLGTDNGWVVLKDGVENIPEPDLPAWLGDPSLPVRDAFFHNSILYAARGDGGFSIHYPDDNVFSIYPELKSHTLAVDLSGSIIVADRSRYWHLKQNGKEVDTFEQNAPSSLSIMTMLRLQNGQIAIGSALTGLWKIDPYLPRVQTWTASESIPEDKKMTFSSDFMSFAEDSNGLRWLATYDGGIIRWDKDKNLVSSYTVAQGTVQTDNFKFIMVDSHDQVWAGSYDGGVLKYNESADIFEFPFSKDDENADLISTGKINHIMERESGIIMISGEKGLVEFDPELNNLTAVSRQFASEDLMESCWTSMEDRDGNLWVGTENGIFIIEDGRLIDVDNRLDRIWFLTQIKSGEVFAASPSGLELISSRRTSVQIDDLETALADKNIYGVLQDKQGQFWISSNAGVFRWDREGEKIRTFSIHDGLLSQEFNLYSMSLLDSGQVALGCIEGLNILDPETLIQDENPPRVFIDQVQIDVHSLSKEVTVYASELPLNPLYLQQSILLTPDDSLLNIAFQSIDLSKDSRIKMFYRLKGFSDDWIDVSSEQKVNFVNLPYGLYEFDLKAVKNDSIVSEVISLDIEIQSSFTQTPAYTILIGLVIISLFLLVTLYILRLTSEITHRKEAENDFSVLNANLEEQVEERTGELNNALEHLKKTQSQIIHQEKMSSLGLLVAGVAHEINTPLGVAVLSNSIIQQRIKFLNQKYDAKDLTEEDLSESLDDIGNASDRLSYNLDRSVGLINNFKQVAVEKNQQDINSFDLISSIRSLINSLYNETKKKNVNVELKAPDLLPMKSYPGDIAQVLTNLIMNTLHHAFRDRSEDEKAEIIIEVEREEDSIYLLFQDNGCGIPEEVLNKVFDPFFTTNREEGGTGLGLHIVSNIVTEKLRGQIAVNSTLGEGTVFALNFPCELEIKEDS
jgi:signal transduction histidine kinase